MKPILGELCVISPSFALPVAIAAHSPFELRVEFARDGMIFFEA
jgi:hypothetical protein